MDSDKPLRSDILPAGLIRPVRASDAAAITGVQLSAWRHSYQHFVQARILEGLSFEKRSTKWEEVIRGGEGRLTVYEISGQPVAFLHLSDPADGQESVELLRLYVAPQFMHQGIGSKLLSEALDYVRGQNISGVYIWVAEENSAARKFYGKHGFISTPGKMRLDSFSQDGSPPYDVYLKNGQPDPDLGEFREVFYSQKFEA